MPIGFLHTAGVHTATFTALLEQVSPGRSSTHVVDESLLADAPARGGVDGDLEERLTARVREASQGAVAVVCTCSTISGAAEELAGAVGVPVVRIDRPMAERAVDCGSRIAVVVALRSTLALTVALLREVASRRGEMPVIDEVVCTDAWSLFEADDLSGYATRIAQVVDSLGPLPDVVVLAQASMAGAADLCRTATPVLSSPRSAVEAAVAFA